MRRRIDPAYLRIRSRFWGGSNDPDNLAVWARSRGAPSCRDYGLGFRLTRKA